MKVKIDSASNGVEYEVEIDDSYYEVMRKIILAFHVMSVK